MTCLQVNSLRLAFQNKEVLDGIQFEIPQGAFLSIIGPNGAGKSVLAKLILGLYPSNCIRILGKELAEVAPQLIGYVPQFKTFDRRFPATGLHLVASGLLNAWPLWVSASEKAICQRAMEAVNCGALINRAIRELSGGELQRLFLARAFVQERKILILDEPATGVDVMGEMDLYLSLEDYRRSTNTSIILITHDLDVARHHSTHVLLINRRQIAFGEPSEVLNTENVHRAFGHSSHGHCGDHVHG